MMLSTEESEKQPYTKNYWSSNWCNTI